MRRLHHISDSNEVEILFDTDDTVRGLGYEVSWTYSNISDCVEEHLESSTGTVSSPRYPDGYLLPYQCETWISAPGWSQTLSLITISYTFSHFSDYSGFFGIRLWFKRERVLSDRLP